MTKNSRGSLMIRILFLILLLVNSVAFAQTVEKPKAVRFDEFDAATNGFVNSKINAFYDELRNHPSSQGYIINYGSARQIAIRRNQISLSIVGRKIDGSRITIVNGGFRDVVKSQLWIVPSGADNPPPDSDNSIRTEITDPKIGIPQRLEEFGEVSDRYFNEIFNQFFEKVKSEKATYGYIVIRGTENETEALENKIRNLEFFQFYNSDKIVFLKKQATKKQATITLWFAPKDVKFSVEDK